MTSLFKKSLQEKKKEELLLINLQMSGFFPPFTKANTRVASIRSVTCIKQYNTQDK